jgi:SpoIID/LytB domain protein
MIRRRVANGGFASVAGIICALSISIPGARADSTVVIDGRGFGHGVGMAQDGAYWLGRSGRSASQILQTFYPGTTLSNRGGAIRVPLAKAGSITMAFPGGGNVGNTRIPAGGSATVSIRGGEWNVAVSGATGTASQAPASASFVAAASATRAMTGVFGAFGFRTQAEPAPSVVTVPVVAVQAIPAPPPTPPTPGPVPVANPVGEPPTTPNPADPNNTVPVVAVVTPPETASTVVVQAADPAATDGSTPSDNSNGKDQPKDSKQTNQSSSARIEATSKGLIGLAGRRYRGSIELQNRGGSIKVVNIVDVEQYLLGMGEILSRDWPAATLQSQAIAARTYAIRMMGTVGEVCPTQACQVYLGAQVEYPQMNAAVAATRGKVVTYKGALANTFYSASGGGTVADPSEGFGGDVSVPYLKAGAYPTGDLKSWTVTMSLSEVARRVGYRGSPSSVAITKVGPSGRAKEVTVYGSAGALKVAGPRFDSALGLRSTFFTFRGSAIGMSPLPSDAGAAAAVEVVTPAAPGPGNGSGFAPTAGQTGEPTEELNQTTDTVVASSTLLPGETLNTSATSATSATGETTTTQTGTGSVVLTTAPSSPTAPKTIAPTIVAGGGSPENNQVSVITEDKQDNDSGNALKILGGVTVALLGAGAIRRLRMRATSKRR